MKGNTVKFIKSKTERTDLNVVQDALVDIHSSSPHEGKKKGVQKRTNVFGCRQPVEEQADCAQLIVLSRGTGKVF